MNRIANLQETGELRVKTVLLVGLGGAVGAVARYLLGLLPLRGNFPIATLLTNLLGAVLIGCVAGAVSLRPALSVNWAPFMKTGVCGGFTTFSSFSLETLNLLENGKTGVAILYVLISVSLCILGVFIGKLFISFLLRQFT